MRQENMTVDRQNEREAEKEEMTTILDLTDSDLCLILSSPVSIEILINYFKELARILSL